MEAPRKGLSLRYLNAALKTHFYQHYYDTRAGWRCKTCHSAVQMIACDVAIHRTPPGGECEESGETNTLFLPYCPQCEKVPASTSTCMHIGTAQPAKNGFGFVNGAFMGEEDGSILCRT